MFLPAARHTHLWVSVDLPSAEVLVIGSITGRLLFNVVWHRVDIVTDDLAILVGQEQLRGRGDGLGASIFGHPVL